MRLYLNKQCLIGQCSEQKGSHLCHLVLQARSFILFLYIYKYIRCAIEIWLSHSSENGSLGSKVCEPCWAQESLRLQLTRGSYSAKEERVLHRHDEERSGAGLISQQSSA